MHGRPEKSGFQRCVCAMPAERAARKQICKKRLTIFFARSVAGSCDPARNGDLCDTEQEKNLVGAPGFEPGTFCAQGRRATRLRYAPIFLVYRKSRSEERRVGKEGRSRWSP